MKLIDNWRAWWKLWSNQAALLFGVAVIYFADHPEDWNRIAAMLPEGWRWLLGVLAAALPIYLRLARQEKLRQEPPEGRSGGDGL